MCEWLQGNTPNYMAQTEDGGKLCELNNGGFEDYQFDLGTFTLKPPASLFQLPKQDCSNRCTPTGPFEKYGPCGA